MHSVGPLRRGDVPLSAVDFHVSDIIAHLLELPELQRVAGMGGDAGGASRSQPLQLHDSLEAELQSAMWVFRSSVTHKGPFLRGAFRAGDQDRAAAAGQQRGDPDGAAERRRLEPLWLLAAQAADRYAVQHVQRRFGRPQ